MELAAPENAPEGRWRDLLAEGRGPLVVLLFLGVWLNAADALVTVTLMPNVARSLGGYAYFAWAVGGFLLGGIVACASGGWLAGRIGVKRGLLLAGGLYALGCAASAGAPVVGVFLAGRLVQGVGAGWLVALVFVAIGVVLPERLAARVFGALAGVWGAATLVGPLIGGVFAEAGLWRWVFWAFFIQALVFMAGVGLLLKAEARPDREPLPPPWAQLALIAAGVSALALAGVIGGVLAPVSGAGGLILIATAFVVDRKARSRILPRGGMNLRGAAGLAYAAVLFFSIATPVHTIYTPILLQQIDHASPLLAGYVVTCEALGWSGVALVFGGVKPQRQGLMIALGGGVVSAGLVGLMASIPHGPVWLVAGFAAVMGAGLGASFPFLSTWPLAGLEGEERALASAAIPTLQSLGGSVGAAFAGVMAVALGLGRPFDGAQASAAAGPLFAAFIPFALIGALAAWRLGRERVNLSVQ